MGRYLKQSGPDLPEGWETLFQNSGIYERYFQDPGRLEGSLRRAAERGELYLAIEDGEAVGAMRVVMTGFCGLYPYLSLISVKDSWRGKGVGGFLMDQLEEMARQAGAKRVTLMVSDFNQEAQSFYRRRGYWLLGTLPEAVKPGIDELVMVKNLIECS